MSETNPTASQRELGVRLRQFRNDRGMIVEEVARELLCSATKISRLETGTRRPSLRDVRDLCELYDLDEATSAELMSLARRAREQGWWTKYDDLDLDPFIGLEQASATITCYSMYYMPGLLQTAAYAEGIIRTIAPKMDPAVVRQRVEVRMRRQEILERDNPPRYRALLDEAVLRRGVGDSALMIAQLDKVLDVMITSRGIIQVIPFEVGAYAAADGYFVLLEFDEDPALWPVVYVEGLTGNSYFERREDVARYRETIDYLRDRALSPAHSVRLITEARDKLRKRD